MEFLNPLFLAGLAAGAIPLVIHLINRRRARLLPFGTLRFLRQIPARTMRRRRLEEYILLAMRVLVLALLALGAAQPVWRSAEAGGGATCMVVVLDDSYSMEYRVSGVTRFQKAAEAAVKVFRTLKEGDRAALLPASAPAGETLARDSFEALKRRAGAARCGYSAASLVPAIRKGVRLLEEAKEPNRELVIVTDLQARAFGDPAAPGDRLQVPNTVTRVLLVDVGVEDAGNLSVVAVSPGGGVAIAGEPVQVTARIRNRRGAGSAARVGLVLGDERVSERTVTFENEGETPVRLSVVLEVPGANGGRVIVEGDNLVKDDEFHFVLPVLGRIPVLLVNGDPSPVPLQDEAFFLRAALDPEHFEVKTLVSPVTLKVVLPRQLEAEEVRGYRAVILANVGEITDTAAARLRDYVRNGGGLLVFGGNRVRTEEINRALGTDPELGILPAALAPPAAGASGESELTRVTEFDANHPIFADLSAEALRDVGRIHIRQVLGADPAVAGGKVVASLEDGRPLLLEKNPGRGKVLLCTASADADWGNLPIRPIFIPLLHRSLRYLAGGGADAAGYLIGDTVRISPPPPGVSGPEVVDTFGKMRLLGADRDPEGFVLYTPPPVPGIYHVQNSGAGEAYAFALNPDAEEGDLARADDAVLREALGGSRVRVVTDLADLEDTLVRSREGQPLWFWFLAAALLLLLAEGILANRIATARTGPAPEDGKAAP